MEIGELRVTAAELLIELGARSSRARHQTDNLEAGKLMVGQGMRTAHVAGTDAEDTDRRGHVVDDILQRRKR